MKYILFLLLWFPLMACEGCKPIDNKLYWSSVATMTATQALDVHSSIGKYEQNPIAQNQYGKFDAKKGIMIKSAFLGTVFLTEWLILRKKPQWKNELAILNFSISGFTGAVAVYNYTNPKP